MQQYVYHLQQHQGASLTLSVDQVLFELLQQQPVKHGQVHNLYILTNQRGYHIALAIYLT